MGVRLGEMLPDVFESLIGWDGGFRDTPMKMIESDVIDQNFGGGGVGWVVLPGSDSSCLTPDASVAAQASRFLFTPGAIARRA